MIALNPDLVTALFNPFVNGRDWQTQIRFAMSKQNQNGIKKFQAFKLTKAQQKQVKGGTNSSPNHDGQTNETFIIEDIIES